MKEQHLDNKSPGFKELIETIALNNILIKSHHSTITIAHETRLLFIENQVLSDCGKVRFKTDDIIMTTLRTSSGNRFLHLFFADKSTIHLELKNTNQNQTKHIDYILKAIEIDSPTIPDNASPIPLCDCCKKYEQNINEAPESHPISVIMKDCFSNKIPMKVEFGFNSTSYCHEGDITSLKFSDGSVKFTSHSINQLNLSRVHSLLLHQEAIENSRYTTLSTYNSFGEKNYSLSVLYSRSYSQWEQILAKMCVKK